MKVSRPVSQVITRKASNGTLAALVDEAEALQDDLRRAYTRTHHLLAAIKKHRRQNQLVQSTLTSLRQLQQIDV